MWIILAWQNVTPEVTVMGFKKCCTSKAVDATSNDVLWNYSEEDKDVRNECEQDEGTDCEDGDRI